MKKIIIIGIIAVVVIIITCFAVVMVNRSKQLDTFMETLQISEANLADIADGTYTGAVDAGMIRVTAQVTIRNHAIVSVELLRHQNGRGKAAESITGHMVQEQKIMVDTISGATLSSRVIQKAVETALAGTGPAAR